MRKPLKFCANGDGRPVQPPSHVLCKECMEGGGQAGEVMGEHADYDIEQGMDELTRRDAGRCDGPCPYCEQEDWGERGKP